MIELLPFPLPIKQSPEPLLEVAIRIAGADMGNFQRYDPKSQTLTIQAQRGFKAPFLKYFGRISHGQGSCTVSMHTQRQVVVENVMEHPIFKNTPMLPVMLEAGAQSCISTPLINIAGQLVGVFSTHYHKPIHATSAKLRGLQNLADWFADRI